MKKEYSNKLQTGKLTERLLIRSNERDEFLFTCSETKINRLYYREIYILIKLHKCGLIIYERFEVAIVHKVTVNGSKETIVEWRSEGFDLTVRLLNYSVFIKSESFR